MIKYGWIKTVKLTKDSFIKNKTISQHWIKTFNQKIEI